MAQTLEASAFYRLATGETPPNPESLYISHLRASMPEPSKQQLAAFMGGVSRRRVNLVLRSLNRQSLVKADGKRYILTDDGLRYLARRDRTSVNMVLRRWSARRDERENGDAAIYHGSSLRTIATQMDHHDAVTSFAATLTTEVTHPEAHEVFDLQPTSRSTIGYKYNDINYVLHPGCCLHPGSLGVY